MVMDSVKVLTVYLLNYISWYQSVAAHNFIQKYYISKHAAVVTHDIKYMIRQYQQTLLTYYQDSYKLLSLSLLFRKLISL